MKLLLPIIDKHVLTVRTVPWIDEEFKNYV
jgi:hypothetical protein